MKVVGIKDIIRKDIPIYYRLLYTGVTTIELTKEADYRIDFSIEIKPTGKKEIVVTFLDEVDYPLVPLLRELKKIIETMHTNGELPD
jgi:translation initiation factor 1 (eIF-1/SUI1)